MLEPPKQPNNLFEFLWYIKDYEKQIFVGTLDGKWQSVSLAELPPREWAITVTDWIERDFVPIRILTQPIKTLTQEEIKEQHNDDNT